MSRGLRFSSIEAMPEGMRQAAAKALGPAPEKGDVRRKYGNCPTTVDGIRFDSKREARYYEHLKILREKGEVLYWLLQVPIRLPGGTKYVVDFQVFWADGRVTYVDAKGRETQVFRLKKREVEHHYPFRIELV